MQTAMKPRPALWRRLGVVNLLAAALLTLHGVLALSAISHHSLTFDEDVHLAGGYVAWTRGDYRVNPEAGQLPQRIAGLPAAMLAPNFVPPYAPSWLTCNDRQMAYGLLYKLGNPTERMILLGRMAMTLLGVALGLTVFRAARLLWGTPGGLLALTLYALSPTVLALTPLMTSDLAAALGFTLAVALVWRSMHQVSVGTVFLGGVAAGLLALAKMSAPLLAPMAVLLALLRVAVGAPLWVTWGHRRWRVRPRLELAGVVALVLLAQFMLVVVLIWGAFGFRYQAASPGERPNQFRIAWITLMTQQPQWTGNLLQVAWNQQLLPEAYLYGAAYTLRGAQARPAYLHGQYSVTGFASFFPTAFTIKTALGEWLALLGAVGLGTVGLWRLRWRQLYRLAPWLTLIGVYGSVALLSNLNIGHRHLLPLYPALFILAGGLAPRRWCAPWRQAYVGIVVGVLACESALCWPHYLGFFNQLVGGPRQGYRWLVDSSLDWGQDLPSLARWAASRRATHPTETIYLSYFGSASVQHYVRDVHWIGGVGPLDVWRQPPTRLGPGSYCISATMLAQVNGSYGGPWTPSRETAYQGMLQRLDQFDHGDADFNQVWARLAEVQGVNPTRQMLRDFRYLQLGRLCAYLRQNEPDAYAGVSILIYHLDAAQIHAALRAPLPAAALETR